MNRLLFPALALLSAATPLVVDSALKGAALMSAALLGALLLWRSSAAARHLVWLVGVLALLAVPLLSLALPSWRVLPAWAVPPALAAAPAPENAISYPPQPFPGNFSQGPAAAQDAPSLAAHPEPTSETPAPAALPVAVPSGAAAPVVLPPLVPWWRTALPSLWSAGCAGLLLRLLGAHWLLRRAARRARAVTDGPLDAALARVAAQLGVTQRVRLLVEEKRTIPVVWGVWRPRLMLPAEAHTWDAGQLQSVLLHELAHIHRRDTLVQWLTQLACALHWFNPLVWLAAWRLHVERERACDDMVLASGVKPSAYAGHLLHIASQLSPARWTSACGLAMARKSALEGRLRAVLSEKLNRRSVTRTLMTAAILLSAAVAVPVAMLRASDEEWNPPSGAHVMGNNFSAFCIHDGKDTSFVIAYHGDFDSSSRSSSNAKARTWNNDVTLTAKKPGLALTFLRTHNAPGILNITIAPAEARDLSKPAPAPRDFGQKEYDLAKGRVFLFTDNGLVRQLDLPTPVVRDQETLKELAALIASMPPQQGENIPLKPNHKDAVALYEIWQRHARLSGDIPGALIGELAAAVKVFIGYNPTWETVPKLNEILPRLDATHDWKPGDAIALLNEVAAVQDSPLQTAAEKLTAATISQGKALPENFANVAWGETQPNGLRAAWVLEPDAAEHRMGTALKARLLVQNTGKLPVMARVPTWHQGGVSARNAEGAEVQVSGIDWTTIARLVPVLLGPGHFIEINAPGVGLGQDAGRGPWAGPRVGSHVLAKDGTELTLTHGSLALDGSGVGMREDAPHLIGPGWWQAHIKARLARELPLPASGAKRTHLLDHAVRELFATTPTADEINAFATDPTDGAFDALVQRLAARADVVEFSGSLPTAPVKFRVLAADANDEKTPRVVLGPGEYPLSAGTAEYGAVTLKIIGRPVGDRRTNDAQIIFEATEATGKLRPDPHKLEIPDGWGTWAIVCRPGEGTFYLLHKGGARKIDYTHPRKVTDTPATDLPAEFRDEVKRQSDIAGLSAESQAEVFEKPAPPAESPAPKPRIRGKVLKSDGSAAVGVEVRVDDGIERWKFRGPAFPDLPRPVKTADDGTFSIDVPKGAVAENYEVFASSDDFAPLNARVPKGGDVGMMQFEKGSRVTGRVIGLDGAGLAKVGIWCKRLDWRGRGPAPMKLTSTGADGTFSIPPIATGRHVLQIITRDLGANELAVAFANQVIEAKDDAPLELEIRPLPTVDLVLDARVIRANAEFRDFEVRVSGTLPGTKPGDPAAYWTRQETTKLAEGKHTIAVPAGLQNTSIRAGGVSMRKGDAPVFIWQRGSDAQPATTSILELGLLDKPQTISVTVRDAPQEEMLEKPAPPATTPGPKSAQAGPRADDVALQPKHESAQSLFRKWQANARTDGKIPGALIGQLARTTDDAVKQTNDVDVSAKLAALRPRLDASRDWTQADVVALLDDLTAIATAPVSWADTAMEFSSMRVVRQGEPLPAQLGSAAWGAPAANGLRAAWLLEPAPSVAWASIAEFSYRLGTVLKARVLFHNTGKEPVVFETETWHQDDQHSARDAKGAEIPVKATWFTGITPTSKFRLAPGEYCEVSGHGIAIGAGEYPDEHSTGAVGAIIEAKEGETVTLSHSVDAGTGGWTQPDDLWLATIAGRVANEAPMPASAADREQLIRRVTLDLTGVAPTPEEIAAFTVDNTPDALAKLTARLQTQPRIEPFAGKLPTGETKFRVIAAEPNAAKAPRTANAPGRYVLGDGVHLQVRQLTEGDKRTNSAEIFFFGPDPKKESPHKPYLIGFYVPDSAYAFVWERGANTLWVTEISEGEPIRPWLLGSPERPGPQKVTVRAFDFSNPADVKLTHVSSSENGGDWSWGKIVPAAFQQPVLNALGERGKRLRDFLPAGESRKLDRATLEGTWEGEKDGVTVKVEFQWLSEHQQVRLEVERPSSSIAAEMSVVVAPDGNSAELIFRKGLEGEATQGRVTPGEAGTLNLEIIPNPNVSDPGYPAVKGLVLKPKSAA
jgi:beta-lactamase regulating signal transducer with metallopeptidase domain